MAGKRWPRSLRPGSSVEIGVGEPPVLGTRRIGPFGSHRMMAPDAVQTAPRVCRISAITSGRPPVAAIDFSLFSAAAVNPMRLLSGDQKGNVAPVTSASLRDVIEARSRTHNSFKSTRD